MTDQRAATSPQNQQRIAEISARLRELRRWHEPQWRATQLDGFGPMNFIVDDTQHFKIVAILENGGLHVERFIANAPADIAFLLDALASISQSAVELSAPRNAQETP